MLGLGSAALAWELTMSQHRENDTKPSPEIDKRKTKKDELSEKELDKASGGLSIPFQRMAKEYIPPSD